MGGSPHHPLVLLSTLRIRKTKAKCLRTTFFCSNSSKWALQQLKLQRQYKRLEAALNVPLTCCFRGSILTYFGFGAKHSVCGAASLCGLPCGMGDILKDAKVFA